MRSLQHGEGAIAAVGVVVLLCVVTLWAIVVVQQHGVLTYEPTQLEVLTPVPAVVAKGVNLNEGVTVVQEFTPDRDFAITHVGIGVRNLRHASSDAVVTTQLSYGADTVLGRAQVRVGDLRADDVTPLPVMAELVAQQVYQVSLAVTGVPVGQDLSVFWEPDLALKRGTARIVMANGESRPITGQIRVQLQHQPSYRTLAQQVIFSPLGLVAVVVAGLTGLALILRIPRRRLAELLPPDFSAPHLSFHWIGERLASAALGIGLALTVTLPYYTHLNQISTMGDVQRALVYRGLARTALLNEGQLALWDPYLCGGEPLLANMESAQLSPFFLFVLFFGENLGTRLSVTATLALGFMGAYYVARRYAHLPPIPALLAASFFPFSGFQMLAFANGNFAWIPVGWIPWVVYFYLSSLTRWWHSLAAAAAAAFIFFGGSIHMTVYALLAVGLLAVTLALFKRTWRPLIMLVILLLVFIPLVAVKLLPVAEVQAVVGSFVRPPPFIQPWSWIDDMFISRQQLTIPQWHYAATGENFRWIEYGAYVGLVPVLLCALAVLTIRRNPFTWALLVSCGVLLLMTFGEFPWTVLHRLPLLDSILRNPQRARVVLLLFFGMLTAQGLVVVGRTFVLRARTRNLVWAAVTGLIVLDLITFHRSLYPTVFNLPRPAIAASPQFERLLQGYTDYEERGYYKVSYQNYLANQGTLDACMPYLTGRGVHARGKGSSDESKPYLGEAWLTQSGEVTNVRVTGDMIAVNFVAEQASWLILNQNFFPGWRVDDGREVGKVNGLVATRVKPGEAAVTLRYAPRSVSIGITISVVTLITILLVYRWAARFRRDPA